MVATRADVTTLGIRGSGSGDEKPLPKSCPACPDPPQLVSLLNLAINPQLVFSIHLISSFNAEQLIEEAQITQTPRIAAAARIRPPSAVGLQIGYIHPSTRQ